MPKFSLSDCYTVFRAVLFLGVFSALLFSSGEGIRLFPFPAAENLPNTASKWKNHKENNYQKNIHRFENNQVNSQTKFQRGNPHFLWANLDNALNDSPFFIPAGVRQTNFPTPSKLLKSSLFLSSRGNRAPPFA